jgi:chromosome segregation ATPase
VPGIGAFIRLIRGIGEDTKLSGQITALQALAERDPLSLVPESYRDCASLQLALAERSASSEGGESEVDRRILDAFDKVRRRGLEVTMQQAGGKAATQEEVVGLVHSLDEMARAFQSDIEAQESRLAETQTDVALLEHDLGAQQAQLAETQSRHGKRIEEMGMAADALGGGLRQIETSLSKLGEQLQSDLEALRTQIAEAHAVASDTQARTARIETHLATRVRVLSRYLLAVAIVALLGLAGAVVAVVLTVAR